MAIRPMLVGICGGSGSGKTTFCQQLKQFLGADKVLHLSQDDYYKDFSQYNMEERAKINFDHPNAIEFELLNLHLESLLKGQEVAIPRYDFATHSRTSVQSIVSPKPVIILEGILIYSDLRIVEKLDHRVFIEAPEHVRFDRRLKRDVRERGRTPESVKEQFVTTVKPMHEVYVEPEKDFADSVVSGEKPFYEPILDLVNGLS